MITMAASAVDSPVSWHYGDPFGEARALASGTARVDLSHFTVLQISGSERLPWLHLLLTQEVTDIPAGGSAHALILSPQGHIEHDVKLVDDGESCWLIAEPGTAESLMTYLQSMVFMYQVTIVNRTDDCAVLGGIGSVAPPQTTVVWHAPAALAQVNSGLDPYVPLRPASWNAQLFIAPRESRTRSDGQMAGMWAWESLRIAAGVPRLGFDIDHRCLPHEVGLIGACVHLHKGCYRGQEAVARTINLGRPPRKLTLLHLDGSTDDLPPRGSDIVDGQGKVVGALGSTTQHYELGPIALAILKRATPVTDSLIVQNGAHTVVASQEAVVVIP